jgi:membrane associated rhomboid family serine protease
MEDSTRNIAIKILSIPVLFSLFLVSWFYFIQNGEPILIHNLPSLFSFNTTLITIENSLYRTFTHISFSHMFSNITSFLFYSFILTTIHKTKYYVTQVIISILSSMVIIIIQYPSVVGFSIATSCLSAISIITFSYVSYEWHIKSEYEKRKSTIILYSISLIYMSRQLIMDISFITGIYTIDNIGYLGLFINEVPKNYTLVSAEVHLFGFISGCLIGFTMIIFHRLSDKDIYRNYFSSFIG